MSPEAAKRPPETPNEAAQATLISQIAAHWKKFRLGNELIFSWLKMQRLDQRFPNLSPPGGPPNPFAVTSPVAFEACQQCSSRFARAYEHGNAFRTKLTCHFKPNSLVCTCNQGNFASVFLLHGVRLLHLNRWLVV